MQDIENKKDIEIVVNSFYEKVNSDELLTSFFKKVNWEKHLPIMYDFWDNVVFYTGNYTGNPMILHMNFHKKKPLKSTDFMRWIKLFIETVDENFQGTKANLMKERAQSIAQIMQIKLANPHNLPIIKKV